jgi:hypothetical protein
MKPTSTQAGGLQGTCPLEELTGETVDTLQCLDFGFYDHVLHKENAGLGMTASGRWLGASHGVGELMSCWVLMLQTGTVISQTTVQGITNLEKETNEIKASINEFEIEISCQFKEEQDLTYDGAKPNPEDWSEHEFDNITNDLLKVLEADDNFAPAVFDAACLNMEFLATPRDGDGPDFAGVAKRLRDKDGLPTGKANNNLILHTRMCEVEHKDGHKGSLAANAIAENMFA